ncbi:MAG: 2-C-methyl-D-erythritol 4-phosphate cytidylyltransferase [Oscillospiraceae bacterium]|nr:2-C-methyl-D-erythritol 4-phosphate cytidylyltransferase [Oscillospiraceae bacterium]
MNELTASAIIACAGSSSRMNGINKQLYSLKGIPVAVRSMLAFQKLDEFTEIIVSARECDVGALKKLAVEYGITKLKAVTVGGNTRQESIFRAYSEVSRETRFVAVHDGARPLADPEKIRRCLKDAMVFGGAALGVPVKDTIKYVEGGLITDTPDRRRLYITQTPQIFRKDVYVKGINFANDHELDFTDDCQLAEAVGVKVCMTDSDYRNIKITTEEDLAIAACLIESAEKRTENKQ